MFLRRLAFLLGTLTLVVSGNPTWKPEVKDQKANEIGSSRRELAPSTDHHAPNQDSYVNAAADYGYAQQHPNLQHPDQQHQHQQQQLQQYQHQQQQHLQPSLNVHGGGGGDFGSGATGSANFGPTSAFHYQIYPNQHGSYAQHGSQSHLNDYQTEASYTQPLEEYGRALLCRMFGAMCDDGNKRQGIELLGILGVVALGLKKLLIKLPFLPIILPLLPILIPMALIILVPAILIVWFLPVVPVIIVGRALSVSAARNVQETLLSENCLERVSCEAFRISRGLGFDAPWIQEFLDKASPRAKWIEKVAKTGRSTGGCDTYTCRPVATLQKSLKIN